MIIYHSYLIKDEIMVNSKRLFQSVAVFHSLRFLSRVSLQKECISNKLIWETVVCERDVRDSKMAKFFKSIFHTTDRRRAPHYNEHADPDEDRSETPQTAKRQLSISRSGRMRQANKKRHSLTLELYGDSISAIEIDAVEKPNSVQYHVNTPSHTASAVLGPRKSRFGSTEPEEVQHREFDASKEFSHIDVLPLQKKLNTVAIDLDSDKSPEEEIDRAFEILDKS